MLCLEIGFGRFETFAIAYLCRLDRGGGREAAFFRAALEVLVGCFRGQAFDPAGDANLAIEVTPVKERRRDRMGGKLQPLLTAVVAVPTIPICVEVFEKNHTHRRRGVACYRGERHGGSVFATGSCSGFEPRTELHERIFRQVCPA